MATVLLVRHGRTTANDSGILAGRSPGVRLDDVGAAQADAVGRRLSGLPLARLVSSPLARCRQTLAAIVNHQNAPDRVSDGRSAATVTDAALTECGYGDWTGQPLKKLARHPLWKTVQNQPSAVTFPDGESLQQMQARAVSAVRRHDGEVDREHGPDALWVAVSHGDVIKAVLADALGLHLDLFQRIVVSPGSVSVVRYTPGRPFVAHLNDQGSDLSGLRPPRRRRRRVTGDAVVGGGAGAGGDDDTL